MRILIIDDEAMQRELLGGFLEKKGYDVAMAADGAEAMKRFAEAPYPLVLLDHKMPDMTGDEVLAGMKALNPFVHAIMITAHGSVDTAVAVMKLGADDFLEKPVDLVELLEKIRMIESRVAIEADAAEVNDVMNDSELPIRIIGNSPGMKEVLSLVRRVAPTPWTVLIKGETGTGKELVARLVHMLSPVSHGPFEAVNCGAVPANLFESELFGHEKGAFSGAVATRRGRFELAGGGSLFLDEIGELPLELQPKLLRALQENRFCRVGGEREIDSDARVIAATNRDLRDLVESGGFREDLFYRLNVFEIDIPPLRTRREDIPALIDFFVERYSRHSLRFDPDAVAMIVKYPFPGNVRELEHAVQRTVTLARSSVIQPRDLPAEIRFHQVTQGGSLSDRLEAVEREMILTALERFDWVQTRAGEALGVSERVLRYKMKKYGIESGRR
jgi:two-component system, NtrC family, response regulator AtoC